jgi:hypothetical protein
MIDVSVELKGLQCIAGSDACALMLMLTEKAHLILLHGGTSTCAD